MCYMGCKYECSGGDFAGECMLGDREPRPDDAECVLMDKRIEEYERRHPVKTLIKRIRHKWRFIKPRWRKQDEIQSWVRRCMNYQNRVKVAGMGATGWFVCFWLTECKDRALAEQFADQIENEDGIAAQTLLAAIQNPNGDGSSKSREWMVYKYVEAFNAINGGKYILSSDGTEVIKGYKKLFKDYCDNMRIQESTKASFNWDFK